MSPTGPSTRSGFTTSAFHRRDGGVWAIEDLTLDRWLQCKAAYFDDQAGAEAVEHEIDATCDEMPGRPDVLAFVYGGRYWAIAVGADTPERCDLWKQVDEALQRGHRDRLPLEVIQELYVYGEVPDTGADPLHALPTGSTLEDLIALIPRAAIVDICQLSRRFQSTTGREWLTRPVSFDPSVWVGNIGASPDVLVGDCLLDLKTSLHPSLERVWLDQLLLYTLVVGDRKRINRLGLHLLRQDRTITWPIDEFLTRAAGGSEVDIERLSQDFSSVAARSSFMSPNERRSELK
jgi:hypothetical protein